MSKSYYADWTENELRNALWHLANGMAIVGGYQDKELLRDELRRMGLSTEGYHNA